MASLIGQCTFKIFNVSQQRCPCICFDKVAIIAIYIQFTTVDIQQLLELYLSECYFPYNNVIWTLENSGPIGLSIMVVLFECYLQRIKHISITQALNLNLAPKTFKRFVDDSHARFSNREQSLQFLDILNSHDPSIQYTIEFENENKQLSFFDITMTNTGNNSYDFKIFRKTSITNVQIKPNSNIAQSNAMGVFQGFLSRAHKICTEEHLQSEIDFLIDILTENEHNSNTLTKIATEYLRNINKPKSNNKNNTKNTKNIIKLPWVSILGPKLRKEFKKKDIKTVFTSGANLKFISCQNKSKLIPYSYPGVYTLNCSCNAEYIGETKKKLITKTIEHQQDCIKRKWESSGATEHCLECHGQFSWLHPKTLSREARYKSRKIRKSLEIIRSKCNSSKLNVSRDDGNFVEKH